MLIVYEVCSQLLELDVVLLSIVEIAVDDGMHRVDATITMKIRWTSQDSAE